MLISDAVNKWESKHGFRVTNQAMRKWGKEFGFAFPEKELIQSSRLAVDEGKFSEFLANPKSFFDKRAKRPGRPKKRPAK